MTDDKYRIIPRGAHVARVTPFEMQVRTIAEYDANFLQDQIRSDVFVNGHPAGVYAVAAVDDRFISDSDGLREAVEFYGPNLERMLVEEFMGLGYRKRVQILEPQVQVLEAQVQVLEAQVKALQEHKDRPRWFHFHPVRRAFKDYRQQVGRSITRLGEMVSPKG